MSVRPTFFLWPPLPCLLLVYGPASFRGPLLPSPSISLKTHQGLSQEKDSPVIPGASSRGLGLSCPFLGLSVAWSPLKIFPFRRPNCRPHCQLLAGYHGNRSQEGSAFLPPWMRRSRGLCEGQRFLLRGQEKDWLWVMGPIVCPRTPLFVSIRLPIFHSEGWLSFGIQIFFPFWWLKCLFFYEMIMIKRMV